MTRSVSLDAYLFGRNTAVLSWCQYRMNVMDALRFHFPVYIVQNMDSRQPILEPGDGLDGDVEGVGDDREALREVGRVGFGMVGWLVKPREGG